MRRLNLLLDKCLHNKSPVKALLVASLGCFLGSFLVIFATDIYFESKKLGQPDEGIFITLNKKVEGGLLENFIQQEKSFFPEELDKVTKLPGVIDLGTFDRNHFPVTINIWPSGRVGLGAAARADIFFESIPDRFIDEKSAFWEWEENQSFVPIMVPKFYLDLWNFGLAPSRNEYPSLSLQSASSMPIEIFIGKDQAVRLLGRFVAFSKRINSVLVPQSFLQWANSRFAEIKKDHFFFVWENGQINGPPISLDTLKGRNSTSGTDMIVSRLENPGIQMKLEDAFLEQPNQNNPARMIIKLNESRADQFFQAISPLGYETNKERPHFGWLSQAANLISIPLASIGTLLSILSIATFTSSYRLMIIQASENTRGLLTLGFHPLRLTKIFTLRISKLFLTIWTVSLLCVYLSKIILGKYAELYGLEIFKSQGVEGCVSALIYAIFFLGINYCVIRQTVTSIISSKHA